MLQATGNFKNYAGGVTWWALTQTALVPAVVPADVEFVIIRKH